MPRLGEGRLGQERLGTQVTKPDSEDQYAEGFPALVESVEADPDGTARERLGDNLKRPFDDEEGTTFDAFLSAFAEEFDSLRGARADAMVGRFLDTARERELDKFGEWLEIPRREDEGDEHYRMRIRVRWGGLTGGGTLPEIIEASAALLETDPSGIRTDEPFEIEPARVDIDLDANVLDAAETTPSEYLDEIRGYHRAGGVRINGTFRFETGGFTYRSESDFENGVNDESLAYNVGRYRGLLENYDGRAPDDWPDQFE